MIVVERTQNAADWLTARLADGPVPRGTIAREATAAGIPSTTLQRAADRLGIISEPLSQFPRRTLWRLP